VQTYTIYERRPAPENIERRVAKLVFVKEGFSFYAFLVPPVWMIVNHMWWEFGGFLALTIFVNGILALLGVGEDVIPLVGLVINLIFAFEARDLHRYALERKGYLLAAIVSGRNLDECERRFLLEWLPGAKADLAHLTSMPGMGGNAGGGQPKTYMKEPVIGMFPAHGG